MDCPVWIFVMHNILYYRKITIAFISISAVWFIAVLIQGFLSARGIHFAFIDFETSGQFGDSFGGLSALMSTLAAIGAWQAVSAQMKDSQKRELENYQNQKVLERQSFETTFFNMLSFFGDMVSTIELPESFGETILRAVHSPSMNPKNPITGKKAFEDIAADLGRGLIMAQP
jgi:hypothetical protein